MRIKRSYLGLKGRNNEDIFSFEMKLLLIIVAVK